MVSFDVKYLYINVPIDDTIDHILTLLSDDDIPVRKDALRHLLKMACTNILFSFDGELYVQNDGLSMGSCLAPTMSAFAMTLIESLLQDCPHSPRFYKRYVDDIFTIFDHSSDITKFFEFINRLHSNI